ncbi:hypothetical protein [Methanosarcina vacuolata]|uniref:hypothetical protein n=1 Tax=Methanosarcina vacuolata TaxID=2215 RepID=UPI00064EFC34|nr:hypothetical protein [Methanosarcina vacuolata]
MIIKDKFFNENILMYVKETLEHLLLKKKQSRCIKNENKIREHKIGKSDIGLEIPTKEEKRLIKNPKKNSTVILSPITYKNTSKILSLRIFRNMKTNVPGTNNRYIVQMICLKSGTLKPMRSIPIDPSIISCIEKIILNILFLSQQFKDIELLYSIILTEILRLILNQPT